MAQDRRQARTLAMQALCQWDVQSDESIERLREFLHEQGAGEEPARYAAAIVESFWKTRTEVDRRIAAASQHWSLERMSPVDRNVSRVAIVEVLDGAVPTKVAINEAIEIGREFGGKDSPRFINGVLDQVLLGGSPDHTDDE